MPNFTNDVFISYSRLDEGWARMLDRELTREGLEVFFDQQRIQAGEEWERRLAIDLQGARSMVVLWSEHARGSDWVIKELGQFEAIRHQGGSGIPDPKRRLIFVNLDGENTAYGSVQRVDDLRAAVAAGQDATTVPGAVWTDAVGKVVEALKASDPARAIPLALFAMTSQELGALDRRADPGIGRPFEEVVGELGFGIGAGSAPDLATCYGNRRGDWQPFGGGETVLEILNGLLADINREVGQPGYRWEIVDFMHGSVDEARRKVQTFCAGPAAVVVDPLSLYVGAIGFRYRLLNECTKNEHALVSAFTPVPLPPALMRLRELTRELGAPLIDPYYSPPIPRHPHPLFAVNVGDPSDMNRLIRSCLGRFVGEAQTRDSTPYLRAS